MDGNLVSDRKLSPFATTLTRLLDETEFYTRAEWARFLGVTPSALSQWVNDRTVPRADLLRMIVDLLRARGGEKAASIVTEFEDLVEKPATDVSPLGSRMSPTIRQYLTKNSFVGLGWALRDLPIEEQERVLADGSWKSETPASVTVSSHELRMVEVESAGAATNAGARPALKLEEDLLPRLVKVCSGRQPPQRISWETALSGSKAHHCRWFPRFWEISSNEGYGSANRAKADSLDLCNS